MATLVQQSGVTFSGLGDLTLSATLPAGATAGNLLWFVTTGDKDLDPFTPPSGFTQVVYLHTGNVSLYMGYKVAVGGETTISATTGSGNNDSGSETWVGEYSEAGAGPWELKGSASTTDDGSSVTARSTGTTGTLTGAGRALAAWAVDSVNTEGTASYSNSYSEIGNPTGDGDGGEAGLWLAARDVTGGTTTSCTLTRGGGAAADQMCGAVAVFGRAATSGTTATPSAAGITVTGRNPTVPSSGGGGGTPTVLGYSSGTNAASASHNVTLPAETVVGCSLLVWFVNDEDTAGETTATPSGLWTVLETEEQGTTTNHRATLMYLAAATGSDSLTVTLPFAQEVSYVAVAVANADTPLHNLTEGGSAATGSVTAHTNLAAGDYLSLVFLGLDNGSGGTAHVVSPPAGWGTGDPAAPDATGGSSANVVLAYVMARSVADVGALGSISPANVAWTNAEQWIISHAVLPGAAGTVAVPAPAGITFTGNGLGASVSATRTPAPGGITVAGPPPSFAAASTAAPSAAGLTVGGRDAFVPSGILAAAGLAAFSVGGEDVAAGVSGSALPEVAALSLAALDAVAAATEFVCQDLAVDVAAVAYGGEFAAVVYGATITSVISRGATGVAAVQYGASDIEVCGR